MRLELTPCYKLYYFDSLVPSPSDQNPVQIPNVLMFSNNHLLMKNYLNSCYKKRAPKHMPKSYCHDHHNTNLFTVQFMAINTCYKNSYVVTSAMVVWSDGRCHVLCDRTLVHTVCLAVA